MSVEDLSPNAMPFNTYAYSCPQSPVVESAEHFLHCVALAKRLLLQEKVRDFTAADVVALAAHISNRSQAGGV